MSEAPLALTMGDPSGIGGELTVAAWAHLRSAKSAATFVAIDDPERLAALGAPVATVASPADANDAFASAIPVLAEPLAATASPGKPDPKNAAATLRSIERAVDYAMSGDVGAVVTNPINKAALYDGADFAYPGHTEYLAALAGIERTVMMLAGPALRVVPVTIHVSLAEAPRALTPELLEATLRIVDQSLRDDFGVAAPGSRSPDESACRRRRRNGARGDRRHRSRSGAPPG